MILLLTGQPGHGKSLLAMTLALKAKEEHREVYICNVKGVDYDKTGFHELATFAEWESLPDGSFVVVDEAYQYIPSLGPGKQGPTFERNLATHRHRGFDMVIICQQGSQISAFVRGLVDKHIHVRRKFGYETSILNEWDRYQSSPLSPAEVKSARSKPFKFPKQNYALYKSAEVHTVKKSLPWQFVAIPVLILIVVGAMWLAFHRLKTSPPVVDQKKHVAAESDAKKGGDKNGSNSRQPATAESYLKSITPLVSGMPWSAPIFADRKPKADPEIICIELLDDNKCKCYTEQVTQLLIKEDQCRQIAEHGIYNPNRESLVDHHLHEWNTGRPGPDVRPRLAAAEEPYSQQAPTQGDSGALQVPPGNSALGYGPSSAAARQQRIGAK